MIICIKCHAFQFTGDIIHFFKISSLPRCFYKTILLHEDRKLEREREREREGIGETGKKRGTESYKKGDVVVRQTKSTSFVAKASSF